MTDDVRRQDLQYSTQEQQVTLVSLTRVTAEILMSKQYQDYTQRAKIFFSSPEVPTPNLGITSHLFHVHWRLLGGSFQGRKGARE
jgi:hypothetical protein